MDMNRDSRKRLRPWLEKMVNSEKCPGLVWENREERTFRIPWRHFNNKEWVERDSQIFMEWAKYTGKYEEGKMEYPTWKTRLRCALKKIPEIKELSERHQLDCPNPYRVYQFVDLPPMKKCSEVDGDERMSPASCVSVFSQSPYNRDCLLEDSSSPPNFLQNSPMPISKPNVPYILYDDDGSWEKKPDMNPPVEQQFFQYQQFNDVNNPNCNFKCDSQASGLVELQGYNIPPGRDFLEEPTSSSFNCSDIDNTTVNHAYIPNSTQNYTGMIANHDAVNTAPQIYTHIVVSMPQERIPNNTMQSSATAVVGNPQPDSCNMDRLPSDLKSLETTDLCDMANMELPVSMTSLNTDTSLSLGGQPGNAGALSQRGPEEHIMFFTVFYGFPHERMKQGRFGAKGCRLFYGSAHKRLENIQLLNQEIPETLFGPKDAEQIEIPAVDQCDEVSDESREYIQQVLKNMERGIVLTTKDGDIYAQRLCRARVFVSDGKSESTCIERKVGPTKVFDYNGIFQKQCAEYMEGHRKDKPSSSIILTIGKEINKNNNDPLGKIFIYVKVQHTGAEKIVKSLPTVHGENDSLQGPLLSSCDTHDQLLSHFNKMSVHDGTDVS